jgi:hypothetical protein
MKRQSVTPGVVRSGSGSGKEGLRRSRRKVKSRSEAAPQQAQSSAPVQAAPKEAAATPQKNTGPGVSMGGDFRACIPGDPTPPGTVMEGYRKLVSDTPFGKACRWELVR